MNDRLRNNKEALEELFDDEFYLVRNRSEATITADSTDKAAEKTAEGNISQPVKNHKKEKMSIPCMVFKAGDNPLTQRNMVEFWRKILASVQLSPNTVNMIELQPGISVDHILDGQMGHPVIFWTGEDVVDELEGFTAYEIHANEDLAFVVADTLSEINKDRDKKLRLWSVLQNMDFKPGE